MQVHMIERKLQEVSDQHENQKDAAGNICHCYFLLTSCKGIHAKELQMHMTLKKPAGNLQETCKKSASIEACSLHKQII